MALGGLFSAVLRVRPGSDPDQWFGADLADFRSRSVPVQIRAFLAIGLSLIISPLQGPTRPCASATSSNYGPGGREALLGLSLGLAVLILFAGLQMTGHMTGQMSGMSLADVFDPSYEAGVSVFAHCWTWSPSIFLVIGGHRHVIEALLDTFRRSSAAALTSRLAVPRLWHRRPRVL